MIEPDQNNPKICVPANQYFDLVIVPMPWEGDSLCFCISKHIYGTGEFHEVVRNAIVNEMAANRKDYIDSYCAQLDVGDEATSFENWLMISRKLGAYLGDSALTAAMRVFKLQIYIKDEHISRDYLQSRCYLQDDAHDLEFDKDPLQVLFTNHNHYDLICNINAADAKKSEMLGNAHKQKIYIQITFIYI